ncbi:MAG: methylamine utilization protein [Gammaproteobacteria bacterium]|nr:methylamine utilization protein [Gammaproteobacteria bacterium]MDH5302593.1 methylamine utilization protein [Gammaproteobacteria bacterium]MDH5321072.1 methylamine utilization protein [Gammaproteobacteria bacterium]
MLDRLEICALTAQVLLLATIMGSVAHAELLGVQVLDPDGQPVPDVVVFAESQNGAAPANATAIMDQVDTRFVPHILVVQKGTAVSFPNSDVVAHHVYSFSKPNNFVLPLYKGDAHAPVVFDEAGIVILGCNIHDGMLGYIVVVDSDAFGLSDASGEVTLELAAGTGDYVINIWSPRIRDVQAALQKRVDRRANHEPKLVFKLQKKLRPPHEAQSSAVLWSEY